MPRDELMVLTSARGTSRRAQPDGRVPEGGPARPTARGDTLLVAAGVDPVVVRQLSGHKSERMTDLYITRLDSRMRSAVDLVATEL